MIQTQNAKEYARIVRYGFIVRLLVLILMKRIIFVLL
jgi:hypothetical protein